MAIVLIYRGVSQSLQANVWNNVPISVLALPSESFPIHNSEFILSFEAL
jgi:hypothetical protein